MTISNKLSGSSNGNISALQDSKFTTSFQENELNLQRWNIDLDMPDFPQTIQQKEVLGFHENIWTLHQDTHASIQSNSNQTETEISFQENIWTLHKSSQPIQNGGFQENIWALHKPSQPIQNGGFQENLWALHKSTQPIQSVGFQENIWQVHGFQTKQNPVIPANLIRNNQPSNNIFQPKYRNESLKNEDIQDSTFFKNRFKGKVVVVTGAAQGIGKSVAFRISQEGGSVVFVDRSKIVETAVSEAKFHGYNALAILADLETFEGFKTTFKEAKDFFGKIDILINNVGGTIWAKPFHEYEEDQIVKEVNRSLFPTLWGCRAVLPYMLQSGGGAIVNISSIATRGINRVPYSAAKGGVNAMTASLAFEYGEQNIRINAIATGGTEAPARLIPRNNNQQTEQEKVWYKQIVDQTIESSLMKRYGTIDEQVSAILYLASDEASYITGVVMPVGGGDLG